MPVDLDAKVLTLALPVQLGIGNVEQISSSDNFLGWNAHKTDLSRVAANFWCPVAEELLVRLDTLTLGRCGAPVEVLDPLNLDRVLVQQSHAWQLIDRYRLTRCHSCHKVVVGRPLERGPLKLLLDRLSSFVLSNSGHVEGLERSQGLSSGDVPDDVVVAIIVGAQHWMVLVDRNGSM